ncbi:MAG: adenylate/guanylate cyclase domain-containing protein [Nitrospirae bacterium]|nr:adenylate/guanylate cyclase domain-containing protein [Nitrospirota bacterium]
MSTNVRVVKLLQSPKFLCLAVALVVTASVLMLRKAGHLELWELKAYDTALRLLPSSHQTEPKTVLIGITEQDVQALGSWPLSDAILARVIDSVLQHRPRVVGVDIYRSFAVPPGHETLESTLTAHPNIVMVMKFGSEMLASVPPLPVLRHTDQVGFNDLLLDRDGLVRRGLLFLDDGRESAYSFPLRLSLKYLEPEGIIPLPDPINSDLLRLGNTSIRPLESNDGGYVAADARGYQFLLDFGREPAPLPTYSVTSLLDGRINPETLRDRIVLIGVTAESVPDLFHTPYSPSLRADRQNIYGVVLHAQITNQLVDLALQGHAPRATLSESAESWWIFLWGLVGGVLGLFTRSTWRFSLLTLTSLGVLVGVSAIAFVAGWWIPLVPPAVASLSTIALLTAAIANREKRDRTQLMQLFSRHVSSEVAETIWGQRELFWQGGRLRPQTMTVTVLFTDLEGFTPASEQMDPQRLMDWTNGCIDSMAEIVMRHSGVVDDYFGDAIKANFGVPVARASDVEIAEDARCAVDCALEMGREMSRLNHLWQAEGLPTARMRIGLFTGSVVAGSLGSRERMKYTTLGDTVNVAARLEGYEKDKWESRLGGTACRILVGESTVRYLDPERYEIQRVGEVLLKGRDQKVGVYQLLGEKKAASFFS